MSDSEFNVETEIDSQVHNRLIKAIGKLDKTQHIKKPTKNVDYKLKSEFHVDKKKGSKNSVNPNDLVDILQNSSEHVRTGKKIKNSQNLIEPLRKPIEKHISEKIKRTTGFEEVVKKLDKWDAVVARNRALDHQKFPLANIEPKPTTKEYVSKFTLKSELENELESLQPPEEKEPVEEVFTMTMHEMVEHRRETARLRAKQSYQEAKARRLSKIKSKKFHRIQRKERIKNQLKEFEVLQKTNPAEALRKLEQLEKTRAQERVTLRHKSTGQWAKNKLVRAKYDKETRQELAEQLALSRELTQKIIQSSESESEVEMEEASSNLQNLSNPWMSKITQDTTNETTTVNSKNAAKVDRKSKSKKYSIKDLEFKKKKNKPIIDEELNESADQVDTAVETNFLNINSVYSSSHKSSEIAQPNITNAVDPNKFVAIKAKHLMSTLPDFDAEGDHIDDSENLRMTIESAFEDDDIVAEFQEEKQNEINKNKPKEEDVSLPGWGYWAGKNLKAPRRKRMTFKAPPVIPRRDDSKGTVFINESKQAKLRAHQVSDLPFPFDSVKDFEATVRAPIGNTFIPETAHKKLIKPALIVKSGVVIEPMDESELIRINKSKTHKLIIKK